MNNFNRLNTITGWIVFAIALLVYTLTMEPTVSFWDCGEFILASFKLEVVHPPGAPLFLLLGRFFTLFGPGLAHKAVMVNFLSALTSAFAMLFTFWIITRMAILMHKRNVGKSTNKTLWLFWVQV